MNDCNRKGADMTTKRFQKKNRGKLSLKQRVECICPRCEKTHMCFMYWTGRGIPRVFCKQEPGDAGCSAIVEGIQERYEPEAYEVDIHTDITDHLLEFDYMETNENL